MTLSGWQLNPPTPSDNPICHDGHFDCDGWHETEAGQEAELRRLQTEEIGGSIPTFHSDRLGRVTIPEE